MRYKGSLLILLLVAISFVPLLDLFHPGLPVTHDGQDHVARIANFYQSLQEGVIVPRWAGNLNWGYGHPILMFLYPLPSYAASFFHFLGFSLVDSIKIVFGLGFIASGLAMYIWLKEALGTKSAFVGAILYMFAPYRFVDLYVRGAIGEHVAFVFLPLTLYFILKLSKRPSLAYIIGGAFALAGLILSHNAIALMFLPIILLYVIYLVWSSKKVFTIYSMLFTIFLGFGLSSFFLLPAFFEGKYTLRDIVASTDYSSRFMSFKDFIYSPWSYGGTLELSKEVGIVQWLLTLVSLPIVFILIKKKNRLWILSVGFLFIFISTLFLMMSYSKVLWENITILQKFQFPWRFLSISIFVTAFLGALVISIVPKRAKLLLASILLLTVLFFNKDYWHAQGFSQKEESFYSGIYNGTTDTGESAPIWSVRFMEERAKANIEVIAGEARTQEIERTSTSHKYKIIATERARIRENTLYFPGWNVFVNGEKTKIEFQDPANRGLITFYLERGEHSVEVKFTETKLRLTANIISFFSLFSVVILGILRNTNLWRRFR